MYRMISQLVVVVLLFGIVTCDRPPKVYTINLDLNRTDIWTQVVSEHRQIVQDAHKVLFWRVGAQLFEYDSKLPKRSYFPDDAIPIIEDIAEDAETILSQEYADEMNGMAKVLNMSVGDIVAMNLIYDATAACTSIVSVDPSGQIWHSRNLDYSYTDILKNLTIAVQFTKAGQVVYSGVTYAGYIGLMTGQRPKGFTITVDERDKGDDIFNFLIAILDQHFSPVSFLVRDTLEKETTFDGAISRLGGTPTAASAYFIVGGTKVDQGAVITKGRLRVVDFWQTSVIGGQWFLVETNYDHWTQPPPDDDRRTPAIKAMTAMGRTSINVQNLYNVMSTPPVLNNKTTYTVVMSAAQPDIMQTWIRD